ncbi:MAG: hypothetical protein CMM99_01495 [Rickettsiales bacterium]|nr:hypothetical protein [Rickettsiales bacterium]
MKKVRKSSLRNISYFDAVKTLKEFRYKPRKGWTNQEKESFKICNFNVLSRKRLNKILDSIKSFGKLGDKSHYKYSEEDLILIKDLILESLDFSFKKFSKKIEIISEDNLQIIQDRFERLNAENQRLRDEIRNYKDELEVHKKTYEEKDKKSLKRIFNEIDDNTEKNSESKKQKRKILADKNNLKNASTNWKDGMTLDEIKNDFLKDNLNLVNTKKKKIKL